MSKVRYSPDKPKYCSCCYYWGGKKTGCELGYEHCHYILPEPEPKKEKSLCVGCPYGASNPCISFCLKRIMQNLSSFGSEPYPEQSDAQPYL